MIAYCKVGTNNKLTVPIKVREFLKIDKLLRKGETVIVEVNFIRAIYKDI